MKKCDNHATCGERAAWRTDEDGQDRQHACDPCKVKGEGEGETIHWIAVRRRKARPATTQTRADRLAAWVADDTRNGWLKGTTLDDIRASTEKYGTDEGALSFDNPTRFCILVQCSYDEDVYAEFEVNERELGERLADLLQAAEEGGWHPINAIDLDTGEEVRWEASVRVLRKDPQSGTPGPCVTCSTQCDEDGICPRCSIVEALAEMEPSDDDGRLLDELRNRARAVLGLPALTVECPKCGYGYRLEADGTFPRHPMTKDPSDTDRCGYSGMAARQ